MPFGSLVGMGQGGGLEIPGTIGGGSPDGPGGKKKMSSWLALAAAPLAALFGQHLGGMEFTEALGAFGQGFAKEKYGQIKQKRQQEFEEEGRVRDMAHEAAMKLKDFTPEVVQKFPKLQTLSQKYQDALANDGKISAKEAQELVIYSKMAEQDMASAGQAQRGANMEQDMRQRSQLEDQLKLESFARQLPQADGVGEEDRLDLAREMMSDRAQMDFQRDFPEMTDVTIGDKTRQIPMTGREQMGLAREEQDRADASRREERMLNQQLETQRHNMELEQLRMRAESARANGDERRARQAEFDTAKMEWDFQRKMAFMKLISQYGNPDYIPPEELDAFEKEWTATMPKKDAALAGRGARPSKDTIAPPPALSSGKPKASGRFKVLDVQ